MTFAEIGLTVGGVLSLAIALFHCAFYRFFNWAGEFKKIGVLNSAVFYTIHLFLMPFFLFFSYISFTFQEELISANGLSRAIVIFYAFLWLFRAIWQMVSFNSKKIKLPPNRKIMQPIMVVWFLLLSASYFTPIAFPTG
jgi:hypothetical protein